jgi:acetyl/propionyl-CoA carboxylase alpha subunit
VSPPFECVAIACRGEIALRVIRACRELGIRSLALVAADERGAIAEREADAAVAVPSYLDAVTLALTAAAGGADALHPGYGFLAEAPELAEACRAAGLAFVGPPADALATLARKDSARDLARRAGVPVVPGGSDAGELGYPLLVKARAGGGGRGLRVVHDAAGLADAVEAAAREAEAAFGDRGLLYEHYVVGARHVEVQILRDADGGALHLGERDCSVQRRHQKVIEEAPAPGVGRELRGELGAAALRLAEAVGYVGAGTAEFLVAPDGSWYFLEMNARIQVEHPVTELVTSIDIVRRQLEIAAGRPLELQQGDVLLRGHAIEARIYAEDAEHGFLPTSGSVLAVRWPRGPGVRVDAGVDGGDVVGTRYDGLLAKLCVHGETRARAIARLRAALDDVVVLGLTTNLPLLRAVASHPDLVRGAVDTGWLERVWQPEGEAGPSPDALAAAARFAAGEHGDNPWQGRWRAGWDGQAAELPVARAPDGALHVWMGGRDVRIDRTGLGEPEQHALRHAGLAGGGVARIVAPMPGAVLRLDVSEGDEVEERGPLLVLEAMKMEHPLRAPFAGRIVRVDCREGQQVAAGDLLIELAAGPATGS